MTNTDHVPLATFSEWMHPRHAVAQVMQILGMPHETAVAAIVRRLITRKITSLYGEYSGPRSKDNHLYPEFPTMPIWCGLWTSDVFCSPSSSVWHSGDLEGYIDGQRFFILNVRFHPSNFDLMLSEFGGDAYNDNSADLDPAPEQKLQRASPKLTAVEPKWAWENAFAALVALANGINGLEAIEGFRGANVRGAQARIAQWFASYFSANDPNGDHPADSECRRRADQVIDALNR